MAPAPKRGSANTKFFVVIVVLIVIIAALAVVAAMEASKAPTAPSGITYGTSSTQFGASTATVGQQYDFSITPNGNFNYATVFWGDGTSVYIPGGSGGNITVSHVYNNVGSYAVYYVVNFSSSEYSNIQAIYPVVVGYQSTSQAIQTSQFIQTGTLDMNLASSSGYSTNISQIYAFQPGGSANFNVSSLAPANNYNYFTINQSVIVYKGSNVMEVVQLPYTFSASLGAYEPPSSAFLNLTNLAAGYYSIDVVTQSASYNTANGQLSSSSGTYTTHTFYDLAVGKSVAMYSASATATGTLTRAELAPGGWKTLDPAIAYDTVSGEVTINTMLPMFGYNGSSNGTFVPILASKLPSPGNGINTNYANWTVSATTAVDGYNQTFTESVVPGQNYTVYINNNSKWQNGAPVTAYDVYYSFVRTLLFIGGSPLPPGWIQAQSILPGFSNSYFNITNNMTYNNATNSITFHLQGPVSADFFFQTFGQTSGAEFTSASWLIAHGAGIQFTPAGFNSYMLHAFQGDYFTYVQTHVMADGPYMVSYVVPGTETVLTANPNFVSPGPWLPPPKIKTIYIDYLATPTDSYLALKSGTAQIGSIPTSMWNLEEQLQNAGVVTNSSFATMTNFWYSFNANVDTKVLSGIDSKANLPADLFMNLSVRQAFQYGYNENHFLSQMVGNGIYHVTFGEQFYGMLPAGMLYSQTAAELNATTTGVPYFNLTKAQGLWSTFVNSTMGADMGLSYASGIDSYNGSALNIPVYLVTPDPVDTLGATMWMTDMQQVIPGLQFSVEQITFVQSIAYTAIGQNPQPISIEGWAPDYPFPSDYLVPMAIPTDAGYFTGPFSMTLSYFMNQSAHPSIPNSLLAGQINDLKSMLNDFNQSVANPTQAKQYYQAWNEMFVNMSIDVNLQQVSQFWIYTTKIPSSDFYNYQMNVMWGGGGDPIYALLGYT